MTNGWSTGESGLACFGLRKDKYNWICGAVAGVLAGILTGVFVWRNLYRTRDDAYTVLILP